MGNDPSHLDTTKPSSTHKRVLSTSLIFTKHKNKKSYQSNSQYSLNTSKPQDLYDQFDEVDNNPSNIGVFKTEKDNYESFQDAELTVLNAIFKDLAGRTKYTQTMDKSSFLKFFNFPGLMGERLFAVFDKNKDGEIDWQEFIGGIRLYLNGDIKEKIKLLFKMYDLGDDGYISEKELSTMLRSLITPATSWIARDNEALLSLSMSPTADPHRHTLRSALEEPPDGLSITKKLSQASIASPRQEDATLQQIVEDAFNKCDINKDGKLQFEEFEAWITQNEDIVANLEKMFVGHCWADPRLNESILSLGKTKLKKGQSSAKKITKIGLNYLTKQVNLVEEKTLRCTQCDWRCIHCHFCGSRLILKQNFEVGDEIAIRDTCENKTGVITGPMKDGVYPIQLHSSTKKSGVKIFLPPSGIVLNRLTSTTEPEISFTRSSTSGFQPRESKRSESLSITRLSSPVRNITTIATNTTTVTATSTVTNNLTSSDSSLPVLNISTPGLTTRTVDLKGPKLPDPPVRNYFACPECKQFDSRKGFKHCMKCGIELTLPKTMAKAESKLISVMKSLKTGDAYIEGKVHIRQDDKWEHGYILVRGGFFYFFENKEKSYRHKPKHIIFLEGCFIEYLGDDHYPGYYGFEICSSSKKKNYVY